MSVDAAAERVAEAWRRRHGEALTVHAAEALSAGAASTSIALDVEAGGERRQLVLQLAGAGAAEEFPGALDKATQARVQALAAERGVPTPAVLLTLDADDGQGAGFVTARVDGETLGGRIVHGSAFAQARQHLAAQCAGALARVHALDPGAFDFLPRLDARAQLAELARLHRAFGEALPAFEAAIAWLERETPEPQEPRLVHGDFRTGNFLVDADGLSAVLDWELAHLGDPAEDIGWLCMRSWRFGRDDLPAGGFAARDDFLARYAALGGARVEPERVRYWELLAALKWGVVCQSFGWQYVRGHTMALEPAMIGRRVAETELHIIDLLEGRGD